MNLGKNFPTEPQSPAALDQRPHGPIQPPLKLWMADDNKEIRGLLANLLTRPGTIECTRQFSSAEAVIKALRNEEPPDAILLDVKMTGMSGIDALQPIRSLTASTHIFLMTTFYDGDLAARAFNLGASGFLLKRHEAERMAECIQRIAAEPVPKYASQARTSQAASKAARSWRWFRFAGWPRRDAAGSGDGQLAPAGRSLLSRPFVRAIGVLRSFL